MIDKLRSKDRMMQNARDFEVGELYLQHCQQSYLGEDSPNDIIRIFTVEADNIVYGIGKHDSEVTLRGLPTYTTNLNPEKFDRGTVNVLERFVINLHEHDMGDFYHIPHGFADVESLFGIDLSQHREGERAVIDPQQEDPYDDARYDKYEGMLIG